MEDGETVELHGYQIFPWETLRAAQIMFNDVQELDNDGKAKIRGKSKHKSKGPEVWVKQIDDCIDDYERDWPITVKVGSPIWEKLENIRLSAKAGSCLMKNLDTDIDDDECEYTKLLVYLEALPVFYDMLESDQEGVVDTINNGDEPEAFAFTKGNADVGCDDGNLFDVGNISLFKKMIAAAQVKSELYPPADMRTSSWAERKQAVWEMVTGGFPRRLTKKTGAKRLFKLSGPGNFEHEVVEVHEKNMVDDDEDTNASNKQLIPSNISIECEDLDPQTNNISTDAIEVTYTAMLKTRSQSVSIRISPDDLGNTEKIVEAAKELWTFATSKGYGSELTLGDVVGMAEQMVVRSSIL